MPKRKKVPQEFVDGGLITVTAPCEDCNIDQTVTVDNMGVLPVILCPTCLQNRIDKVKREGKIERRGRPKKSTNPD